MPKDSRQDPVQSYQCSHCVHIFKSKLVLLVHLDKHHGLDVHDALRHATSTAMENDTAQLSNPDNGNPRDNFASVLQPQENNSNELMPGLSSETYTNKQVIMEKEDSSIAKPTSELVTVVSRGANICKRTPGKIIKNFTASSVPNVTPSALQSGPLEKVRASNTAKKTLVSRKCNLPPILNGNCVLSTSVIDLSSSVLNNFQLCTEPKIVADHFEGKLIKRAPDDSPHIPAPKKSKRGLIKIDLPKCVGKKSHFPDGCGLMLEFSDGEEEKMSRDKPDHEEKHGSCDMEGSKMYSCKHCDYSIVDIQGIHTHYQKVHPFIRYNSEYIQDPNNWILTYRCLECPIEFGAVGDLQGHYKEKHPDALSVFTVPPHELQFVFKCFVCAFVTDTSKVLKDHYQEEHPSYTVNNNLMYCRYAANGCKNEFSQYKKTLCQSNDVVYKCESCGFGHKSVVAMLVHHHKYHPNLGVTIDQIKQTGSNTNSLISPEKSSEYLNMDATIDKSCREENVLNSTEKKSDESPSKKSPINSTETPSQKHGFSSSCEQDLFFCPFCNYTNQSLSGISSHQETQHAIFNSSPQKVQLSPAKVQSKVEKFTMISKINEKSTTTAQTASVTPLKNDCAIVSHSRVKVSKDSHSSQSATYNQYTIDCSKDHHEQNKAEEGQKACSNQYEHTKNLFFCPKCNYATVSARGVLKHNSIRHLKKLTANEVLSHTAMIQGQIEKSKSQKNTMPILSSGLPLPIVDKNCEVMFFCNLCNFSHTNLTRIMGHQKKSHHKTPKSEKPVLEYSSEVNEQIRKKQIHLKANQNAADASPVQCEMKKLQTGLPENFIPVSKSTKSITISRSLNCHVCAYKTPHLYLLKRHLRATHQINRSVPVILKNAFEEGTLKAGFYCEWCVFSHKNAVRVYRHYQKNHTSRGVSLKHIITLHAGPKNEASKKKPKKESSKEVDSPVTSLSQESGSEEPRNYPCQSCSFKGGSPQTLTKHYLALHPRSVKEDGSVLNVISSKGANNDSHAQAAIGHQVVPASPDNSLQHEPSPTQSPSLLPRGARPAKLFKCRFCSVLFVSRHGLSIHYGMKHTDQWNTEITAMTDSMTSEAMTTTSEQATNVVVYKCPACKYVNTRGQGVLTHCQRRHTTKKVRAQILKSAEAHIPSVYMSPNRIDHRGRIRFSGFMCKFCQMLHPTLEKIKSHYRQDHKKAVPSVLKPAVKLSVVNKKQLLSKDHGAPSSLLQSAFFKKGKRGLMKCSFCSYTASTQKCLSAHYKKRHGKEAFLRYRASLYKKKTQKATATSLGESGSPLPPGSTEPRESHHSTKDKNVAKPTVNSVQCKKCKSLFSSYKQLSVHYTSFHRKHVKADFTILYDTSKKIGLAIYTCGFCSLQIRNIRKLCSHLDHHRKWLKKTKPKKANATSVMQEMPTNSIQCNRKVQLPELQTVQELAQLNVTRVETSTLADDGPPHLSPEREELKMVSQGAGAHVCKHCGQRFSSLKGLRGHERSHEAVGALQRQDTGSKSLSEDILTKHISYRAGTLKPFYCCICSYRTNLMDRLKSHFMKKHFADCTGMKIGPSETVEDSGPKEMESPPSQPDLRKDNCSPAPQEATETIKKSLYVEPAEVQRQLSHYRSMARANTLAPAIRQAARPLEDRRIHCEFCDFLSEHLSNVRRHYARRHGKKLLRCKDCSFLTGIRKNMDMHRETGHSNGHLAPKHEKNLRCPFCLYVTKTKNHMIDHIALHREEHVIPMEVRRPKLSRCLQGIVFRCHKCTFTSATSENLSAHVLKHDGVRPYQCRLCYFDCTQLSELEAHLCDKHQVVRNHELVGQVNLDQLGMRIDSLPEREEQDGMSLPRVGHEEVEDREIEVSDNAQEQEKEVELCHIAHRKQDTGKVDHVTPDPEEHNRKQDFGDGAINHNEETYHNLQRVKREDCKENGVSINTTVASHGENIGVVLKGQQHHPQDENKWGKLLKLLHQNERVDKANLGVKAEEQEMCVSPHQEEEGRPRLHRDAAKVEPAVLEKRFVLSEERSRTTPHSNGVKRVVLSEKRKNHMLSKDVGGKNVSAADRYPLNATLLTKWLTPCRKTAGDSRRLDKSLSCQDKQDNIQTHDLELGNSEREMPVLENVYLKEGTQSIDCQTAMCQETDWNDVLRRNNQERKEAKDEGTSGEYISKSMVQDYKAVESTEEANKPFLSKGTTVDSAVSATLQFAKDDRMFTCTLCGRIFTNGPELEHHIKRHGM